MLINVQNINYSKVENYPKGGMIIFPFLNPMQKELQQEKLPVKC